MALSRTAASGAVNQTIVGERNQAFPGVAGSVCGPWFGDDTYYLEPAPDGINAWDIRSEHTMDWAYANALWPRDSNFRGDVGPSSWREPWLGDFVAVVVVPPVLLPHPPTVKLQAVKRAQL